jgi:hypothetical protein
MPNSSPVLSLSQSPLPGFCPLAEAVNVLSRAGIEERGAIFARRKVVDSILDLAGQMNDQPLHMRRLFEPSFGGGDFPPPAVERLLVKRRRRGEFSELSEMTNVKTSVTAFAGHIASEAAR